MSRESCQMLPISETRNHPQAHCTKKIVCVYRFEKFTEKTLACFERWTSHYVSRSENTLVILLWITPDYFTCKGETFGWKGLTELISNERVHCLLSKKIWIKFGLSERLKHA